MKEAKKILKSMTIIITTFLILSIIVTILNYFNLLNYKIINIIKIIIPALSAFIGGYNIGKESEKKGWLEGIKLSLIITLITSTVTFLLKQTKLEYIIYILILSASCILGSIIGINKTK